MPRGLWLPGREDMPWVGAQHPGAAQLHGLHVAFIPLENQGDALWHHAERNGTGCTTTRREMSLKHHLTQKGGDKTGGCEYTNQDPA